ncbi:hypothetical protein HFA01_01390 [Halobacillus faecis]|uniref:Uncharacterized protein n=1 Tax=Halobacillus faecis TaxID=360184 RepID=A0A511WL58_9BACI|nr:hypothetical protein HFA01_01390 [Halobacillus faecis]
MYTFSINIAFSYMKFSGLILRGARIYGSTIYLRRENYEELRLQTLYTRGFIAVEYRVTFRLPF